MSLIEGSSNVRPIHPASDCQRNHESHASAWQIAGIAKREANFLAA